MYVINDKGNVVKVTFGDPNMGINRDDPSRKNFRARHQCDTKSTKVCASKDIGVVTNGVLVRK